MSRFRTLPPWLPALLFLALFGTGRAEDLIQRTVISGESAGAVQRLHSARQAVREARWSDALTEYQALQEEIGDRLVLLTALDKGGKPPDDQGLISVPVRWVCQRDLAALPPEGLKLYRARTDAQARKWLDQGLAERDAGPLRRIVAEAMASKVGAQALDLLGDLAQERGRFDEAIRWWRMASDPVFADSSLDKARLQAKQLLARALAGESPRKLRDDLTAYQTKYARAEGSLAGRQGRYVETLAALMRDPTIFQGPNESASWTTFAGDAERSGRAREAAIAERLKGMISFGPAARFNVAQARLADEEVEEPPAKSVVSVQELTRGLMFHPVIAGKRVLVADGLRVLAFDPIQQRGEVWFDLTALDGKIAPAAKPAADVRYTLTVAEGRVFARLGRTSIGADQEGNSWLVCLALDAADGRRLRWATVADDKGGKSTVFEGTPIVEEGRLHVGVTSYLNGRVVSSVRCYSARTDGPNGPTLLWEQELAQTSPPRSGTNRTMHHLLTRAGPLVVACTNNGAIVALDAATGRRAWAVRYPLGQTPPQSWPHDLAPPMYAQGLVYVTPTDSDALLALDPLSGQIVWQRDRLEVVHLLGFAAGQLLFTTPRALRAVEAATGDDRDGWQQPADGSEIFPCGRGLIVGPLVLWPMHDQLNPRVLALNAEDGEPPDALPPDRFRRVKPGHMAYADGILAVAGTRTLEVYVDPAFLPAKGREDARLLWSAGRSTALVSYASKNQSGAPPRTPKKTGPWHLDLDSDERLLVVESAHEGDPLFFSRHHVLVAREPNGGRERWSMSFPFEIEGIVRYDKGLIVAGRDGFAGLVVEADKPSLSWKVMMPHAVLPGWRLSGDKLICFRDDRRRLTALDARNGRVLWDCWAPAGKLALPGNAGRFQPSFEIVDAGVVAQTSGGRMWVIELATGQVHLDLPTAKTPWAAPPMSLPGQFLVLEAQAVARVDPKEGREVWRWRPAALTTLSGEPLQAVLVGEALMVEIPRNFGPTLQKIDLTTGRDVWPLDQPLGNAGVVRNGLTVCGRNVAVLQVGELSVFDTDHGRRLNRFVLPESDAEWKILRHQDRVLVYSATSTARRFEIRWPLMTAALHLPAPSLAFEEEAQAFWFDGSTGRLQERLFLDLGRSQGRLTRDGFEGGLLDWSVKPLEIQALVMGKDVVLSRQGRLWGRSQ